MTHEGREGWRSGRSTERETDLGGRTDRGTGQVYDRRTRVSFVKETSSQKIQHVGVKWGFEKELCREVSTLLYLLDNCRKETYKKGRSNILGPPALGIDRNSNNVEVMPHFVYELSR